MNRNLMNEINPTKLYLNFKIDILDFRCWLIDELDNEIELTDKWTSHWGETGFNIWLSPDWEKSGKASWVNFRFRYPRSGPPNYEIMGPETGITSFRKYCNPETLDFRYFKKSVRFVPKTRMVYINFEERNEVIKSKDTRRWAYIQKK